MKKGASTVSKTLSKIVYRVLVYECESLRAKKLVFRNPLLEETKTLARAYCYVNISEYDFHTLV